MLRIKAHNLFKSAYRSSCINIHHSCRNMTYAAIIIGSGQAGGPLAMAFANAGKRTALIEQVHIGGTCINEGW
jgi:heterodisulfide reductase subunit A-like polyferredoxin